MASNLLNVIWSTLGQSFTPAINRHISTLEFWVPWPAPCNHGTEHSTGAAFFNQPLERAPMQIVRQAFFNLRLIYALCQAHVENTRGWYTWFITPEHVSPTKQPQPPKKQQKKTTWPMFSQHGSGLYYELQLLCGISAAPLLSAAPEMEDRDDKMTITHQITGFEC